MAIYKFPNLAQQTETSTTQGYYSGLNRPTPVGNMYGNQTVGQTKPNTPNLSGNYIGRPTTVNKTAPATPNRVSVDPTSGRFMLDGQLMDSTDPRMWGRVGRHVTQGATMDPGAHGNVSPGMFDPNYYEQYTLDGSEGSGGSTAYRLRPDVASRLNGRVQLGQSGVGGYGEVIDPSRVEWDDEFGMLTTPDNFKDPQDPRSRRIGYAAMAAFGAPAIASAMSANLGAAGASSGGSFPMVDAPNLAMPATIPAEGAALSGTPLIEGGSAMSGLEGGVNTFGSPPPGGNVAIPPDGGGGFNWGSLYGDGTAQGFLGSPAGRLAGAFLNRGLSDRTRTDTNTAANRADPFGPYRDSYAQRLDQLYRDPSYLETLPGYRFRRDQGEQAIERQSAQRGYFRSPNMLYNLSQFNQGLASQALNEERTNLANFAGANFNPGTAGQLMASGYGQANEDYAGTLNSVLGAGGDILDYFFSGNNTGVA